MKLPVHGKSAQILPDMNNFHAMQVEKIMAASMKMGLSPQGFTTAACVLQQREMLCLISTGCKDLDSILEGITRHF